MSALIAKDKQDTKSLEAATEEAALAAKNAGNDAFLAKNYSAAIECYSAAISIKAQPAFYSNRAACHLAQKNYGDSLCDAMKAVEMDPSNAKYHYRAALACEKSRDFAKAAQYLEACLERDPHNKDFKKKFRVVTTLAMSQKRLIVLLIATV